MKQLQQFLDASYFWGAPIKITQFRKVVATTNREKVLELIENDDHKQAAQGFWAAHDCWLADRLGPTFPRDVRRFLNANEGVIDQVLGLILHIEAAEQARRELELKRRQEQQETLIRHKYIAIGRERERRAAAGVEVDRDQQAGAQAQAQAQAAPSPADCRQLIARGLAALEQAEPDIAAAKESFTTLKLFFHSQGAV